MRLKIRCDEESKKFCKIFWKLNKVWHGLLSIAYAGCWALPAAAAGSA